MRHLFSRFVFPLRTGTRSLIAVLAIVFIAQAIGEQTGAYNLIDWCVLAPTKVWQGQVWRLFTYAFVTPTLALFAINILFIGMLGHWLERVWSPREWWAYCLLCSISTGIVYMLMTPFARFGLISNLGMVFGLLVACGRIFSYEHVLLMGVWKMTIRSAALVFGLINFFLIIPCGGWVNALILLTGGIVGWLYLSLRWKFAQLQSSRVVDSARIGRLEL